jgi:hypothetical protein
MSVVVRCGVVCAPCYTTAWGERHIDVYLDLYCRWMRRLSSQTPDSR